jgi:class 3 adenylate cyclase/ABC-type nitrate/sulfonate/bicarbonate transport system substrate-binding protein
MAAGVPSHRCALWRSIAVACVTLLATFPAWALDSVSLQLKWKHQFQFAGYYAALEKGFYQDAGLDVEIREGGPDVDAAATVAAGKAEFGVCTSSVLLGKVTGQELVVLGVIFQHSAAVILVPRRAGIGTVSELKGHRLMDTPGSDEIAAMLKREGVDYAGLPRADHDGDVRDLFSGKADAMVAYSTNEPFILEQLGAPYQTFSPRAFGIDFYGDNLCTSARQIKEQEHPERVRAFRAASLKGWQYALSHKEEIADLILSRYSQKKSRDALLFEATKTEALVRPALIELGYQNLQHWQHIAETYRDLGMLNEAEVPDWLIYGPDDGAIPPWAKRTLLGSAALAVASILVLSRIRFIIRYLQSALGTPKLSAVMSVLFVGLSIPILIFILLYNYHRNSAAIVSMLHEEVAKTQQSSIENAENLIRPVASTLKLLAGMAAADPAFFRTEQSQELLYRALTSAPQIDAAYVSFEDGYHRVVTRIDNDRRRSDPKIPPTANWHSSYIDDFSAGKNRTRHRTFFDTWARVVGQYDVETTMDIRTLPGYRAAKESGSLVVTEPTINPDTGYPVIFVRFPIVREGEFIGCATANITFDILSRYLGNHRASARSTTIIADPTNGEVIAYPDQEKSVRTTDGRLEVAKLDNIADDNVREAYQQHTQANQDDFLFRSPLTGEEMSAAFTRFPDSFGQPWEVIILTPTNDFVGSLKATNQQVVVVIIVLITIEFFLIYFLSARLSRPIESVSQQLKPVESLSFDSPQQRRSKIREIAQLESAVSLLRNSLQSFCSFVPLDVVRQLIKSGTPLTLGVEPRFLTVFFSDLENFSTHAEQLAPNELLGQMSTYFEEVSRAISDEHGTVDKFIGDGVMAFWGAPADRPDHVLRACAGALRAARRMERVNEAWTADGRPKFRIRIGLHCGDVLVGNVGSSERLSYTVMGDGVNVAARLEGMNKIFGTTICISDSIVETAGSKILARPLRRVQVKGRESEFMIYELLGIKDSSDPELKVRGEDARLSELSWQASAHFVRGDFATADRSYRKILEEFPNDPVAKSLLEALSMGAHTTAPADVL